MMASLKKVQPKAVAWSALCFLLMKIGVATRATRTITPTKTEYSSPRSGPKPLEEEVERNLTMSNQ